MGKTRIINLYSLDDHAYRHAIYAAFSGKGIFKECCLGAGEVLLLAEGVDLLLCLKYQTAFQDLPG